MTTTEIRRHRAAQWNLDHPDRYRATRQAYYAKNSRRLKAKFKRYYREHREQCGKVQAMWRADHPWFNQWAYAKRKAFAARGVFTLTHGDMAELWVRDSAGGLIWPCLERIDDDRGYGKDNCRFVARDESAKRRRLERVKIGGSV